METFKNSANARTAEMEKPFWESDMYEIVNGERVRVKSSLYQIPDNVAIYLAEKIRGDEVALHKYIDFLLLEDPPLELLYEVSAIMPKEYPGLHGKGPNLLLVLNKLNALIAKERDENLRMYRRDELLERERKRSGQIK